MTGKDKIRQRTLEVVHLQAIEGNPLDADDIAMFEMFDREGFSTEEQLDYISEESRRRWREKMSLLFLSPTAIAR